METMSENVEESKADDVVMMLQKGKQDIKDCQKAPSKGTFMASPAGGSKAAAAPSVPQPKKAAIEPLRRKVDAAEQVMNRCTRNLAELDAQLADPDLYVKNPGKVAELTKRRENAKSKLDEAEEAWMALAEELAEAEA